MLNRLSLSLVIVTACAALAACGSDGSSSGPSRLTATQYKQRLRAVSHREDRAHAALERAFRAKSATEIRRILSAFAADQQTVGAQLAALTPPQNAKTANAQLAGGFRATAAAIRRLMPRLAKAKTPKAEISLMMSAQGPQRAGHQVDAALTRLKKLGYTKGS